MGRAGVTADPLPPLLWGDVHTAAHKARDSRAGVTQKWHRDIRGPDESGVGGGTALAGDILGRKPGLGELQRGQSLALNRHPRLRWAAAQRSAWAGGSSGVSTSGFCTGPQARGAGRRKAQTGANAATPALDSGRQAGCCRCGACTWAGPSLGPAGPAPGSLIRPWFSPKSRGGGAWRGSGRREPRSCRDGLAGLREAAPWESQLPRWHIKAAIETAPRRGAPGRGQTQSHPPVLCCAGCRGRCAPPGPVASHPWFSDWLPGPHLLRPGTCLNAGSWMPEWACQGRGMTLLEAAWAGDKGVRRGQEGAMRRGGVGLLPAHPPPRPAWRRFLGYLGGG